MHVYRVTCSTSDWRSVVVIIVIIITIVVMHAFGIGCKPVACVRTGMHANGFMCIHVGSKANHSPCVRDLSQMCRLAFMLLNTPCMCTAGRAMPVPVQGDSAVSKALLWGGIHICSTGPLFPHY
jgi:hypothetical protein